MKKTLLLTYLFLPMVAFGQIEARYYCLGSGDLQDRIVHQPDGPFAVIFFDDRALGKYIGVVFYDNINRSETGTWNQTNRFWQEKPWCADVTGICWSFDRKHLYVSTSGVYGEGVLFDLDLYTRKVSALFPSRAIAGYRDLLREPRVINIKSANESDTSLVLIYRLLNASEEVKSLSIKIK